MWNKIMKKYLNAFIFIVLLLFILIGLYMHKALNKTEYFSGINGEKISVHTNIKQGNKANVNASTNISLGDIVEIEGSKEIVIAVSADGRFITMPLADYQAEQLEE